MGKDAESEKGELPRDLLIRLQLRHHPYFTAEEAGIVEACLDSDPRTEVLILRAIEFCLEDEYPNSELISVLCGKGRALGSVRMLLRLGATQSLEKRGGGTLSAMQLLDALGEGDRIRTWFFTRAVGMDHFDLSYRDEMLSVHLSWEAFDWIYPKAFDSTERVPLLIAGGKNKQGRRFKEVLNLLARQPEDFLRQYDLGDLSEPLQELRELISGISDSKEVTRICESKLGLGEFAPPRYAMPPDLTAEEIAAHQQLAEADEKSSWENALVVLSRRSAATAELNRWLEERLDRITPRTGSWARVIAHHARDFDLARKGLEHLLRNPDGRPLAFYVERFCGARGPWKLPAEEGVDLIRRAQAVKLGEPGWEESDRGELWLLMIRAYGDHVRDFSDLLLQVKKGRLEHSKADQIIRTLWEKGLHRQEIREMVERRFTSPYHSELPTRNELKSLSLLKTVESPFAWDLWMEAAEKWPDDSGRIGAVDLLASQDATNPEFIALLQRLVQGGREYLSGHASRLLAAHSPSAFRASLSPSPPEGSGASVNPRQSSAGFDAEGFRQWQDSAEARRRQWMSVVSESSERWELEKCAHSLAFWFGDHPESLPCLIDRVCREWEGDDDLRQHCLKVIACRWAGDERVHKLARWAIGHPFKVLRDEAARILARDHASAPDTVELLERHLGDSDVVFEEYVALRHRDPGAMRKGLDALAKLGDSDCSYLLSHGPNLLARAFGPRKDLKMELGMLAERTPSKSLRESIRHLFKEHW